MTGLGRGLGALLQDSEKVNSHRTHPTDSLRTDAIGSMNEIDVNLIEANPYQPRTKFDQECLAGTCGFYPGSGNYSANYGTPVSGRISIS